MMNTQNAYDAWTAQRKALTQLRAAETKLRLAREANDAKRIAAAERNLAKQSAMHSAAWTAYQVANRQ